MLDFQGIFQLGLPQKSGSTMVNNRDTNFLARHLGAREHLLKNTDLHLANIRNTAAINQGLALFFMISLFIYSLSPNILIFSNCFRHQYLSRSLTQYFTSTLILGASMKWVLQPLSVNSEWEGSILGQIYVQATETEMFKNPIHHCEGKKSYSSEWHGSWCCSVEHRSKE